MEEKEKEQGCSYGEEEEEARPYFSVFGEMKKEEEGLGGNRPGSRAQHGLNEGWAVREKERRGRSPSWVAAELGQAQHEDGKRRGKGRRRPAVKPKPNLRDGKEWERREDEGNSATLRLTLNSSFISQTVGNVTAIMNEHRPDCVPKDQWISLETYWISDKGKTVNVVEPSRAHDMTNEKLSLLPGGKEVTNGNVIWEGDVYSQVMKEVIGEESREHLDDDLDQYSKKMEFLEAENKRLQDKLTRLEGQQTEVLDEIARLRALVDDSLMDGAAPSNSIET
ncbi:hypothetical protein Cgig2_001251 [Carnegiea gigantea]|uniref:Uncharacterized protein n=1 Tax=Carnegiea gigantea TaxID=171969 RepID=A0A9Q1JRL4_9CARY|nr:hypothetical protein Cgig2_001251 [Carnegiea gigantea]